MINYGSDIEKYIYYVWVCKDFTCCVWNKKDLFFNAHFSSKYFRVSKDWVIFSWCHSQELLKYIGGENKEYSYSEAVDSKQKCFLVTMNDMHWKI